MEEGILAELDEIDREILRILSGNPRMPYNQLSSKLEERGHEMTGEGVRYRVSKLLDATSPLFLLAPAEHGWEILRVGIRVENSPGAVDEVYGALSDSGAWLVTKGFGKHDLRALATTKNNKQIREFLSAIRGIEQVKGVDHFIETDRRSFMENYLAME